MRRLKLLALLLAFIAVPSALNAQMLANAGFGIFGGVSMPMGEFADDDVNDEESGFATMGFMVGADMHLPFGDSPLGWVTSASVNSFGVDSDEAARAFGGNEGDFGRYWIVPVLTGASYPVSISPTMSLVPMAQVGLNFVMGPSGEVDNVEGDFSSNISFAFSAGATLNITQNIGVTARYLNAGAPEREIDIEGQGDAEKDSPMSFLQIGVSYTLP